MTKTEKKAVSLKIMNYFPKRNEINVRNIRKQSDQSFDEFSKKGVAT